MNAYVWVYLVTSPALLVALAVYSIAADRHAKWAMRALEGQLDRRDAREAAEVHEAERAFQADVRAVVKAAEAEVVAARGRNNDIPEGPAPPAEEGS